MSEKPIIEFPCDYLIKIIGRAGDDFDMRIIAIINKHQDKPFEGHLQQKDSKEKNYRSFTITIRATSKEQLQALFEDLKKDEDVMMVL
jgi:putative lipoic acid-binding regulatory protein